MIIMTNNTTKIITLLAVLIVSATLSGCIGNEPEPKMVKWNNGVIVDSFSKPVPEPVIEIDTIQIAEIAKPVPTVITTPTPTVIPTPTVTPVVTSTPTPTPYIKTPIEVCATRSYIRQTWKGIIQIAEWHDDDEIIFSMVNTRYGGWGPGDSYDQLELIKIYVDDQLVATIIPNIIDNPRGGHRIMNNTCIIKLPDGLDNSGEIKILGTFVDLVPDGYDYVDGEYRLHISVHRQDDSYQHSRLDDIPIYQG